MNSNGEPQLVRVCLSGKLNSCVLCRYVLPRAHMLGFVVSVSV